MVRLGGEAIADLEEPELGGLLERIGDARLVLLGEASHGTSEFYRVRQRITRELIERAGFDFVAVEADWPDAALIDRYVRGGASESVESGFRRFPQWMWRNTDVLEFVTWLRAHNDQDPEHAVSFHGLDLYSLHDSIYRTGRGEEFLDAEQNAAVARDAERYYRAMYYGGEESWNLRDRHMFTTLQALLDFHGPAAKGVIWAHNSHLGDARATGMSARGQLNLGQLVRAKSGIGSYHIGFGTDHGTVLAAPAWGQEPEVMQVQPGRPGSYEHLFHQASQSAFLLPLKRGHIDAELRRSLCEQRLERAIGVVYRPRTELASHYFDAVLPVQFDEYCWIDETTAITPLGGAADGPTDPRHPFAALDA